MNSLRKFTDKGEKTMENFIVSQSGLETRRDKLKTLHATLDNELQQLKTIKEKLDSYWEGDAKGAFDTTFASDYAQFKDFMNEVKNYITVLTIEIKKYEEVEKANKVIAQSR